MNRREFLKGSVATVAVSAAALPTLAQCAVDWGAGDSVSVFAVIEPWPSGNFVAYMTWCEEEIVRVTGITPEMLYRTD